MAAITGVTINSVDVRHGLVTDKFKKFSVSLSFGDGALTYPSGGVPLTKTQLGFRNTIRSLLINNASAGDGFVYKFDSVNSTIRIYQGDNNNAADAPLIELLTSATPAATTLLYEAEGY